MDLDGVRTRLVERREARYRDREAKRLKMLKMLCTQVGEFVDLFPKTTKVVVFGSLTREGYFDERSDVDIAIWGLPNAEYWAAMKWFEQLLETEKIDLVQFEDAHPRIVKHILRGQVIYDGKV